MDRGDEKATETLGFRATPSMAEGIKMRAAAERRSTSEWIRLRMEDVLKREARPVEKLKAVTGTRSSS